ncbi:hybrid sensor histidine kinase/response regulator [Myxosarcina sp. GI1]|uniref:hybrid sensor histidine kinase/response regulator n=1 Tax=Myxosarcina sp. GI1 TaxID=1541065 RepID=UPI0005664B7E|nr:hybrid sensor histidine kinase/response regulator [Myxosarcina sp. GI1]
MNSQDKSRANDNWDERDLNLSENEPQTASQNEELDSDFQDLWTEEDSELVTDIILEESNDLEDSFTLQSEEPKPSVPDTIEGELDFELSDWDFRNPLDNKAENNNTDIENSFQLERSPEPDSIENSETVVNEERLETESLALDLNNSLDLENIENNSDWQLEPIEDSLDNDSFGDLDNLESLDNESLDELEPIEDSLDNDSFGDLDNLESLDNESLGELEPIEDSLDNDSLGDLDNLLGLETQPESLDSIDLDAPLETVDLGMSLDSDSDFADLDAIVGLDESKLNAPSPSSTATPASVSKAQSTSETDQAAKANTFDQTMRVSVRKLDNLNNLIGELVVKRNRLEDDHDRLRRFMDNLLGHVQSLGDVGARMHDTYERSLLEGALLASRKSNAVAAGNIERSNFSEAKVNSQSDELDALEMDRFTGFHLLSQEIIELIVRVREAASDIQFVVDESDKVTQTLRQVTTQLQEGINSSRMIAFGLTADRLPRAVRQISRQQKKQAELHIEGKEVLIDKLIVENLYNPMTHLVNNAISHGIEPPEKRLKLGKPAAGNISIQAFIQGNQTVITVADDGAGIDPERVKNKAVEKNLITWAQAQNLTQPEIYDLLFHPGFSTKDQADDFAGRGVGMDVVLTDLKKIRGTVGIESEIGKGTTFTIRLPLVLSICKALICVDKNNQIAFPIDGVEKTKEYFANELKTNANGVKCVSWQDRLLPLQPLSNLLAYNRKIRRGASYSAKDRDNDTISVVILRSVDNFLAVEVDEIQNEQEIVIKQIEGSLPKPPGIAGATVLGDGTILPIGDVLELIEIAQGRRTIKMDFNLLKSDATAETNVRNEPMVLVVDDSITVRELLSMSFIKLGYRVEQARDGQEAWDKLRGGLPCNMIFCDIEMPRMNGLELLSNLQKHDEFKRLPVAMLTSRGADKHRKLASELGAQAYLTKPYTEKDLMDVAHRLIEVSKAEEKSQPVAVAVAETQSNSPASSNREFDEAPLVLIIDDSVTVRELLSMTFEKAGYRVEKARDGREAWEKLKEGLPCDIAFCDIEMPRMNGLELLAQLQQDERLSTLPIAMLTSRGAQKMRNIAAEKGARGYFVKPYVEDVLLDAAKRMIDGEVLIDRIDLD